MAHILLIETATDVCSVAVARDGVVVSIRETGRSYSHSEVITLFVEQCLAEAGIAPADLVAVAVTSGPGSYTALRIGSSTAKGMCYALDIPLISVDTLKSMAVAVLATCEVSEGDLIIPLLDARRKEVYRTIYNYGLEQIAAVEPIILESETFAGLAPLGTIHFCGDGAEKSKSILAVDNIRYHDIECSAASMVYDAFAKWQSGDIEDTAYFTPFYFKAPNITVQKKNILIR